MNELGTIFGTLRNTNFVEIFSSVFKNSETGILSATYQQWVRNIFFRKGDVIYASSNVKEENLTSILFEHNIISEQDCKEIFSELEKGVLEDKIIQSRGLLNKEAFIPWKKILFIKICGNLFCQTTADFRFLFDVYPPENSIAVAMSTPELIFQAIKQVKDVELLERWIGPLSVVPFLSPSFLSADFFHKLSLSPQDGFLLSRIDGNTSLKNVIKIFGKGKVETYQFIYAALAVGLIDMKLEDKIARELIFDINEEKKYSFKTVRKEDIKDKKYHISLDELSLSDDIYFLIDGKEVRAEEIIQPNIRLEEIKEEKPKEPVKKEKLLLTREGLENKHRQWLKKQRQKEIFELKKAKELKEREKPVYKVKEEEAIEAVEKTGQIISKTTAPPLKTVDPELESLKQEIIKLQKKISVLNYYEILDINQEASLESIKEAYISKANRFNPGKFNDKELGILYPKLVEIHKKVLEAYQILSDAQKREIYDQRLEDEKKHLKESLERRLTIAERNYVQGIAFLEKNDVQRAAELFRAAISLDPSNPFYYEKLASALSTNARWIKEAQTYLRKAIKLKSDYADFHIAMGDLLRKSGQDAAAVRFYRNALKLAPENDAIKKQLAALGVAS